VKTIPNTKLCQFEKKIDPKSNIPTSFIDNDNIKEQKDFVNVVDKTYEESLKNNIIPLISTFTTNPLTKDRIISEMGSKPNNDSLHKVKKKINKNKTNILKTSENLLMNKNIFNDNFGSLLNDIKPLDSLIYSKPVNNGLIAKQGMAVSNLDCLEEPLDLAKIKFEEELLNDNDIKDDDLLELLNMNQKFDDDVVNGSLLLPPTFMNPECDFGSIPTKPLLSVPKRSTGALDEILAPFKKNTISTKVKTEEIKMNKNGFSSFNCFNFDEMNLPKIELPQERKFNSGGLDDIAKFSTNVFLTKIKTEKIKPNYIINGVDMSKVKQENDEMSVDVHNNPQVFTPMSVIDSVEPNLMNIDGAVVNNLLANESLLELNTSLVPSSSSSLLSHNDIVNQNIAIECYNTELNFFNNSYALPNSIDYHNNVLNSNIDVPPTSNLCKDNNLIPTQENILSYNTIKTDVNEFDLDTISCNDLNNSKNIHCCANSIPLATTTSANVKAIPDWYNQDNINPINPEASTVNENTTNSPHLIKPLVPALDDSTTEKILNNPIIPDFSKEIVNEHPQYTSFLDTEIPLPFTEANLKTSQHENKDKIIQDGESSVDHKSTEELSENIINEIIDRLSADDKLKDVTSDSCFAGQNVQDTSKMLKKITEEIDSLINNNEQLEASEKKWNEWRKNILVYENEAHQWLNARIEFYSRRVNEYRKDWIEYWIKRYLMQHKQKIKSLSYYINIPQNLQFATSLCVDSETASTTSATPTTTTPANTTDKKNSAKSVGRETIEQFKRSTTSLVALIADVERDPHLEVSGTTIDVANKDLLNNPKLIDEYHEKLLTEKKLLLEKYDIVDSLDLIPSNHIKPITEDKNVTSSSELDDGSMGYKDSRKENEEVASVLIDEYVKAPFESKRIFIHGIPKDYQLMFNDKMKSLIFILDKCIQDKKDLFSTMEENRKKYSVANEA